MQVAETREKRSVLATEIIKGVMLPQFVILPLAVLLVWLALVGHSAAEPAGAAHSRAQARTTSRPWTTAVPLEVAPLVSSVNDLLHAAERVAGHAKRFLADAAHQLKTPLAGCACRPTWRSARAPARKS